MKLPLILGFFSIFSTLTPAQNISGVVLDDFSKNPVEFVNVGVVGKNIGTVSDEIGTFDLMVDSHFDRDTLLISCIGYMPFAVPVSEFRNDPHKVVLLKRKIYSMKEVLIRPRSFTQKTLGFAFRSNKISAGFTDNKLGYELGVLMKVRKSALLKQVNIHISFCNYDSITYRLNVYKVIGKMDFENVLQKPIYINLTKAAIKNEIQVDLLSQNILVSSDFLVTLEHVKDLGKGGLYFCAGLGKTYYKKTSQGQWDSKPVGISISAVADVEK